MADNKVYATAVVPITLEIPLTQPWSGSDTVERVFKSARSEAKDIIVRAMRGSEAYQGLPPGTKLVDLRVRQVAQEEGS